MKRATSIWIRVGIVAAVAAAASVLFFRQVETGRRKDAAALIGMREEASALADGIAAAAKQAAADADKARAAAAQATNTLLLVTGQSLAQVMDVDRALAGGVSGPLVATQQPPAGPKPKEETPPKTAQAPRPGTGDMPEGMPSREQLDRYRAAHQEKKESPDSVQTPHGGPEPAAPPAKPAVEGEPPPSKETQATQVVGQVAGTTNAAGTVASAKPSSPAQPDIRELCRTLIPAGRIVEDKAETLGAAAAEAATLRDGVLAAPHAAGAAAKMTPLRKLAESADADRKEEEKQRAVLFAAASSVDALRRATEEKKEKERQETEKRRKLAEQRAAAEKEMERVKRLPEENRSFVARNDFAGALAAAQAVAAGLATDEAKSAARVLTDRYACLNELKAFLIERLNAEPFQWGWGFGATALDVLGATESEVKLKAKTVYWLDVSMPQMLKFIERYVPDKKVRMRTRGRLCLATAILCEEHGQTENKDKYRKKAVELASDLEAEAARLLSP